MPEVGSGEDLYEKMCRHEFGDVAASILTFLAAHLKKGMKVDEPRKDFDTTLGGVFNDGVIMHLRKSLWGPIEEARGKKGLTRENVAETLRLAVSTYSKIQAGGTNLESALLFMRPLGLEARDLPLPSQGELTVAGLLSVVPLVRDEVFGAKLSREQRRRALTAEDAEWLLHLDVCGAVWLTAFLRKDERTGSVVAACVAASIGVRLNRPVEPRTFSSLVDLWSWWFKSWEMCMQALPTGRLV